MADDQTPSFIPAQPSFIPAQQVAPNFIPAKPAQAKGDDFEYGKLPTAAWRRLWEPVKAEEVERVPGLDPNEALRQYQQFEQERAQGKHRGQPNPYEAGSGRAAALATVNRTALKSATDFFSPGQLAMRLLSGPAQAVVGGAFVAQQAHDVYENWPRMSAAEKTAALAGVVGGSIMTGHGVATTKVGARRAAAPTPKGEPLTAQDHAAYINGLLPYGEAGGLTLFKEPKTGGTVAVRTADMANPSAVELAARAHRERFSPSDLATNDPVVREHRARQQREYENWRIQYYQRLPPKVGFIRYWFSQPVRTMRESGIPEIELVGQLMSEAEVNKSRWFHGALYHVDTAIKGLNGQQVNHVGEILDRWDVPQRGLGQQSTRTGRLFTPDEIAAATRLRIQLLRIWEQLHLAAGRQPGPFRMGFIENYLPHFEKFGLGERLMTAIRNEFGAPEDRPSGYTREPATEKRGRGLASLVMRRRGALAPDRIEYDIRKVLPAYLRGVSRVLFDRPAILNAEDSIKNMPANSTWRQYADAYLDKYTYKMHQGYYDTLARRLGRSLMNMGTRSVLGFSPRLQQLHLARLLTTVWPEMNSRDFAYGLAKVAQNPKLAYERAAMVGILPQTVPLKYMSGMQRFDTLANYLGMADFIDRSVAYEGQYHRHLREGLTPEDAMKRAATDAKDFSFLSTPAHTPLAFGHGAGMGFGDAVSSVATQYKHIPTSILYQYGRAMVGIKGDPVKAAKFTAALLTAALIQYKTGAHLVHFASPILIQATNVVGSMAKRVNQQLQAAWTAYEHDNQHKFKQHLAEAVELTLELLVPGGLQVERARRYGIKSIIFEPSAAEKKQKDRIWKQQHR